MAVARRRPYFDATADAANRDRYYVGIDAAADAQVLIPQLSQLLVSTHQRQLHYAPSEQLYPWVDLRPDQHLCSIYSGARVDPEEAIRDDARIARARADRLTAAIRVNPTMGADEAQATAQSVEQELHFNCEHVVPQSWFEHREPMRGDLHHLFTCEPKCNAKRGNIPYAELSDRRTRVAGCGRVRGDTGFEPFAGKGPVARATLYFLLRYPGIVGDRPVELQPDALATLISWHGVNPVTAYEQHRNAAIFGAQGNRNPFIDFPDLAARLDPSLVFTAPLPPSRATDGPAEPGPRGLV